MVPKFESESRTGEPTVAHQSFSSRLREIGMFFDGTDRVHAAMRQLTRLFDENQVAYAIVGGMAVNAHRHIRTTGDVDFLIRPESLPVIRDLVKRGLLRADPSRGRRFVEPATGIHIDLLLTGAFPGSGNPGPMAFPDPAAVSEPIEEMNVVNLVTLIDLKLAAHRFQDFADVVSLIRANALDETFLDRLHPAVRSDFIECLEEMRREDEYETRP